MKKHRLHKTITAIGDIAIFYLSLVLTLVVRYGTDGIAEQWALHFIPFTTVFAVWLIIFIIADLYGPETALPIVLRERLTKTMIWSGIIAIIIFYAVPAFNIAPKTNLIIHTIIAFVFLLVWRTIYGRVLSEARKINILFFGFSREVEELAHYLKKNPHLGYMPAGIVLSEDTDNAQSGDLPVWKFGTDFIKIIREKNINIIVAARDIRQEKDLVRVIYNIIPLGVAFSDFPAFYEQITGKIPVSLITDVWFLENLSETEKRVLETIKRGFDLTLSSVLGIITLVFLPFIALAIKIESRGPVFFRQKRAGKGGEVFELVKFRSMKSSLNENTGWSKHDDSDRMTLTGKILRSTYLDELPQVWNIFKGDISLIGPRPERPEFVEELKEKVPHYMMRLLVRPGISGWAQTQMKYDAAAKDALEKLQYDLYYIKHRSLGLDLTIALRTIATLLSRAGR